MKLRNSVPVIVLAFLVATLSTAWAGAPESKPSGTEPDEAEMMAKMMELAKPGEPHKLLAGRVGTWAYTVKMSMPPGSPLADAGQGTAVRTALMDGRYFSFDVSGKMGGMDFKGMSLEGYDNVKKKYLATWIDSMGTSIVLSEGSYDPATKSFTYAFEMEALPGMKMKARQVVTLVDADHERMEWYEMHGGQEAKTMEIDYTRQK